MSVTNHNSNNDLEFMFKKMATHDCTSNIKHLSRLLNHSEKWVRKIGNNKLSTFVQIQSRTFSKMHRNSISVYMKCVFLRKELVFIQLLQNMEFQCNFRMIAGVKTELNAIRGIFISYTILTVHHV